MPRDSFHRLPDPGTNSLRPFFLALRSLLQELFEKVYASTSIDPATVVDAASQFGPIPTRLLKSNTGAVTLAAKPIIGDGTDGETILLVNVGSGTLTLKSGADYNLQLGGDLALAQYASVRLIFLSAVGDWIKG